MTCNYNGAPFGDTARNSMMFRKFAQGALAGLVGSAAMHVFRFCWERATHGRRRDGIFGFDHEADIKSAELMCEWLIRERLSERHAARLGIGLHYAYGAALGALYAATKARRGWLSEAGGIPLGTLLWFFADEIPISLSGISDPFERTIASHASALAAHLLFAIAVQQSFYKLKQLRNQIG